MWTYPRSRRTSKEIGTVATVRPLLLGSIFADFHEDVKGQPPIIHAVVRLGWQSVLSNGVKSIMLPFLMKKEAVPI